MPIPKIKLKDKIKVYDSLTRREVELALPGEHPVVTIYVCGMTTYDYAHVGSMRGPVFFDVVRRFLSAAGYNVIYVQNFTDVDDKTIARAAESGMPNALELSAKFNREYYRDLFALGVQKPQYFPKVTGHIKPIIEYIKVILDKGYAYVAEDNVYFSVNDFPGYLKLSGRNLDDLRQESRQTEELGKRDPLDFALWKAQKPGEPAWDSPWGPGRPGWHIECSTMSTMYLGEKFDIHGGGQELKFPHHENEIAQTEAHSGPGTFARLWMHYEWVTFKGGKMAKSGEFFRVRDILKEYDPEVVRMFLLSSQWRKPVDFSREKFDEMHTARKRLVTAVDSAIEKLGWHTEECEENLRTSIDTSDPHIVLANTIMDGFIEHMSNDFNTQGATASMFEMANHINKIVAEYDDSKRIGLNWSLLKLMRMADILGILQDKWHKIYFLEDKPKADIRDTQRKGEDAVEAFNEAIQNHVLKVYKIDEIITRAIEQTAEAKVKVEPQVEMRVTKADDKKAVFDLLAKALEHQRKQEEIQRLSEEVRKQINVVSAVQKQIIEALPKDIFSRLLEPVKLMESQGINQEEVQKAQTYYKLISETAIQNITGIEKVTEMIKQSLSEVAPTLLAGRPYAGLENVFLKLLNQRDEYRAKKFFTGADLIRKIFADLGVEVQDTPDGPKLKWE